MTEGIIIAGQKSLIKMTPRDQFNNVLLLSAELFKQAKP